MDSQERHELQQNELQEFFSNFGSFWTRWGNTILTGVLIVILAVTAWRFWTTSQANAYEEAWYDLAIASEQPAVAYREVAESHDNPAVKALAYLRGGDAALEEARGTRSMTQTPTDEDAAPADPAEKLDLAEQMYQAALDTAPADVFRLNALLGLGAVAESREDWDAARDAFGQVVETAGPGYQTLASRAQVRLDLLESLAQPRVFAPSPTPAATEAAQPVDLPASEPEAAPATEPAAAPAPAPAE